MDYAEAAEALLRKRMLEDIYDRMSDDEKRLFVQMTIGRRNTDEILSAIGRQSSEIGELKRRQQTFSQDFLSNILGNAAFDGAVWVLRRLAGLLR